MKKIISLVLALALTLSSMLCVSASDEGIKVYLEGNKINFDVQPQTINNRTMVPIRAIFEAMGATVTWDNATQTAISTKDNTTVKMTLNRTTVYVNDNTFEMDVTPVVIDGRTLAPARYVAEAFGYYVNWDSMTKSVLISKNTNFDVSQVKDGTREHPYKFGDTVSMTVYGYADDYSKKVPEATVELTLNSLMSFSEIKKKFPENSYYFYDDDEWFINANINLVSYIGSNAYNFFDFEFGSKAVTNKLTTFDTYSWYSNPLNFESLEFYEGGNGDCYIHIDTDKIEYGQTIDYFTITYSSGSNYNDEKTIWFSLK